MTDIGRQLLNVPMGDMIRQMAFAIADAQHKLDASSIESAEMMGGLKTITDDNGNVTFTDSRVFFGAEYTSYSQFLNAPVTDPMHDVIETERKNSSKVLTFAEGTTDALGKGAMGFAGLSGTSLSSPTWHDFVAALQKLRAFVPSGADAATNKTQVNGVNGLIDKVLQDNSAFLNKEQRVPTRVSMLELGFAPTFYQFVDTIIEVKISISITQSNESSVEIGTKSTGASFNPFRRNGPKAQISTSQVNASYASKYSYTAEGSSLLRTKLVPIPTPQVLEQRIEALMEQEAARRAVALPAQKT